MAANWQDATDTLGAMTQEFSIETNRGRPVTGAIWNSDVPSETLMCFGHGASDDRYQAPICELAARFQAKGIPSISIDGPVHGLRRVEPGGREALKKEMQSPTAFSDMVEDWNTAIELVKALPGWENLKLAYFGLSMGSIFGIPFVAQRDDMVAAALGLLGTRDNPFGNTINSAAENIHLPIRFIVQLEDELFDRESCLALFDRFSSKHKSMGANPGIHAEVPNDEIDAAFDFLMRHITGSDARNMTD